ncbi:MAG: UDP-N-acetylmuramoyl-L-alanine--D-glutamate ligase [Thermodesulfobacteriota bacterium]
MNELVHADQLRGHRVAVLGAGRSGIAGARLASALGAQVVLADNSFDLSPEIKDQARKHGWELKSGEHSAEDFVDVQMIILSPGVPKKRVRKFFPDTVQIFSELELASWFVSAPMIAITGTNGKTSTTMLVSHVLTKCGKTVFTGGNIGTPLSEFVLEGRRADILVLEVSSFQLQNVSGFCPAVGVLLNFSANHLDFHLDEDEYWQAKLNIFARQKEDNLAIVPFALHDSLNDAEFTRARKLYFVPRGAFNCPNLPGEHNQSNMEAAFHACRYFGINEEEFNAALHDFKPPEHRQEVFLVRDGIRYVDDSKATTVDALRAALASFPAPIRLLAGGIFKGGDLRELRDVLRDKVSKVYLFGDSREFFEGAWRGAVELEWFPGLEEATRKAVDESKKGDNILLSPATASFDLFSDYKQRGLTFKKTVKEAV